MLIFFFSPSPLLLLLLLFYSPSSTGDVKLLLYPTVYRTSGVIFFIDYCTAIRDT